MILFVLPAATIYDKQDRVMGWKSTPPSRDAMRELKHIVPRLRELHVSRVVACDLLSDSGKLLARRLNVPYEEWSSLRRFNVGRHHGAPASRFQELFQKMSSIWTEKPDVPVKGGDSLTSFNKRVAATREKLTHLQQNTLIVADPFVVQSLVKTNATLERNRVYQYGE